MRYMAINKVEYGGKILIDLTQDTVTPETLAKGEIAHNAAGEQITGTMESGGGGGSEVNTDTCTIVIGVPSKTNYYICCEIVSGGAIAYNITRHYTDGNITKTARCGSVMYVVAGTIKGATVTDGEVLRVVSGQGLVYKTPSTKGASVQITLSN